MDQHSQQFRLPQCDQTEWEEQIWSLRDERDEASRRPITTGTDKKLLEELAVMTLDAAQSGQEVEGLRMQLANDFTFVARVAPAAPQELRDRG